MAINMTIKQIQNLLAYLGYYKGQIDGIQGSQTREAIENFQKACNLNPNGIAGADTQKALPEAVYKGLFASQKTSNTSTSSNTKPTNNNKTGEFWDNIKYFTKSEFTCKCGCGTCDMNQELIECADQMREDLGVCNVTSGHRCATHNAKVGGVSNSRHLSGKAMDFSINGKTSSQILDYINTNFKSKGIIRYCYAINDRCVHMDVT